MGQMIDKNKKTLEKRYPGISSIIEEKAEKLISNENIDVIWEESFEGEPILKVNKNGRILYLAGRRSPSAHAVNQVKLLGKIVPHAPVMIFGMGNINYLKEVLKTTDKTVEILLYEPLFSIFYKQIQEIDLEEIFGERLIALVVGGINDDGLEALLNTMLKGDKIPLMKQFSLPNYEELAFEKQKEFFEMIVQVAERYQIDLGTRMRFNTVMADNIYHNVRYLRTGYIAGQLDGVIPKDIPAIVVAAGPSLNKNIHELKRAKNKAFIIAVDTAMKPLINAGIIPDMYAMLDGIKYLSLVDAEEAKDIPLLALTSGTKEIFDFHKGKKFFVDEQLAYIYEIFSISNKKIPGVWIGGSVATLAFSLVCHLGFSTIVMVGQDLAFTGNKSHVDGAFMDKMKEEDTSSYLMVPGNYEKEVPTLPNLNDYRKWFETHIKEWKEKYNTRFINATEGGARIEGTELKTLKEVIDEECKKEVNVSACIEKLNPIFTKEEQDKILDFFHNTPKRVHEIVLLAEEGEKIYHKLEQLCKNGNVDKNAYLKLLKKIKRNRKQIEKNENYQIIAETMVNAEQIIRTSQYFYNESIEEEGLELARQGILYMELLQEYAKVIEELAKETVGIA